MDKVTGRQVYRNLMDLGIILADMTYMGPWYSFLNTITDDTPVLIQFNNEILQMTARLQKLIDLKKRK